MQGNKLGFQKLTPIKSSDMKIYNDALDFVFSENDLRNIAITGPYSAGKSSVIETYKGTNKDKKFIHISLAHFEVPEKVNEDETDNSQITVLEGKILNQLIHQIDANNIPKTHFKIKKDVSKKKIAWNTVLGMLVFIALFHITRFETWNKYIMSLENSWVKDILIGTTKKELLLISGIICTLIVGYWLYSLIRMQSERSIFRKIKLQGNEIEIFENTNESYFDKYLNEVLYIFKNADADVIVFEDIDRYNNNKIFEKIREINTLVNKQSAKVIRFFYLLRDDIFINKDRTKFFDFILPIVPILDGSNSYDQFIDHFKKGGIFELFDEKFLQELSLYIDDMRMLKNIYNEFVIYYERIQTIELNNNKLLAIITYKNIFPRDFSELQLGRGYVHNVISNKDNIIRNEIEKIDKKISDKKSEIAKIEDELLKNIDELDALFLTTGSGALNINGSFDSNYGSRGAFVHAMKQNPHLVHLRNISYNSSFNFLQAINNLSNNEEYSKRKKLIEQKTNRKIDQLRLSIKELENRKPHLRDQKLKDVINSENINMIFNISTKDESGSVNEYLDVKLNPYYKLIIFLIRNGYVDETYPDYLTYFYENSLNRIDKIFLRSVTDRDAREFEYKLKNPEKVVSRLRDTDFDHEEVLNFDLLQHLLATDSSYLNRFLEQLKDHKRLDFVWQYINQNKEIATFVNKLSHIWTSMWQYILDEDLFSEDEKKDLMVDSLYFSAQEDILEINTNKCITHYISSREDFLDISAPKVDEIIPMFEMLEVRFKYIDYRKAEKNLFQAVYEAKLYELNFPMISLLLKEIYEEGDIEDHKHKNFTLINSKPEESLFSYVLENINSYMDVMLDNCGSRIYDNESSAIVLLNESVIEKEKKELYIKYLESTITCIEDITDVTLWEDLLISKGIKYTSNNILRYYFEYAREFNNILIDFINSGDENIYFTYEDIVDRFGKEGAGRFYKDLFTCNKVSDNCYQIVLSKFGSQFNHFTYSGISDSKIDILIKIGIISMTKDNLLAMRENYNPHMLTFVCSNISDYIKVVDDEVFLYEEMLELLSEDSIEDIYKIKLLDKTEEPISIKDMFYSHAVEKYILQNNFDIGETSYLLKSYCNKADDIKAIIKEIMTNNIDLVIKQKHNVPEELLKELLLQDKLELEYKKALFIQRLPEMDITQVQEYLTVLRLDDFLSLFEGKRPKFEITDENKQILDIFFENGWITQYDTDKDRPEFYRAIGRKLQFDDEEESHIELL